MQKITARAGREYVRRYIGLDQSGSGGGAQEGPAGRGRSMAAWGRVWHCLMSSGEKTYNLQSSSGVMGLGGG